VPSSAKSGGGESTGRFVQVYLNGWMRIVLSLEVNANGPTGAPSGGSMGAAGAGATCMQQRSGVQSSGGSAGGTRSASTLTSLYRPYHTLLLLQDEAVRLSKPSTRFPTLTPPPP
jgi:hypothetical protein